MVMGATRHLAKLRRNVWRSPAELEAIQVRKLRALVQHAYANVPYYRRLFDEAGVRPERIRGIKDLSQIPITSKADLRAAKSEMITEGVDLARCRVMRTSGSTGTPLTLYINEQEKLQRTLVNLCILFENGFRFTDSLAYIGDPRHFPKLRYWFQHLGILRRHYLSVFDDPINQLEQLQRLEPAVLYSYPTQLALLAKLVIEREVRCLTPKLVFTSTEVLTPQARRLIQQAFGVDPVDVYGCVEVGDIAWQCPERTGFHVNSDALIVEIIQDGHWAAPGKSGEIVVTSLDTFTLPLIRYRLGDVGVWSSQPCPCGRSLPVLRELVGRQDDFVILEDGRTLSPRLFGLILRSWVEEIAQYAVRQTQPGRILVQVVAGPGFTRYTPETIVKQIRKQVGQGLEVEVEVVTEIERDQSGKIRFVVSTLWSDRSRQQGWSLFEVPG